MYSRTKMQHSVIRRKIWMTTFLRPSNLSFISLILRIQSTVTDISFTRSTTSASAFIWLEIAWIDCHSSITFILLNRIDIHYISSLSLAMPHLHMGVSVDSQYLSHLTSRYRAHFRYFIHQFHKSIEFVAKWEQCLIHITLIVNKFYQILWCFKQMRRWFSTASDKILGLRD